VAGCERPAVSYQRPMSTVAGFAQEVFPMQKRFPILAMTAAFVLLMPAAARAARGTFDRTLHVSGTVALSVNTGSGYIHVTPGPAGVIHIVGHVQANGWTFGPSLEERVQRVVNNPPIEQSGNTVTIGGHQDWLNSVSIDYEITAPRGTQLEAGTGSGDLRLADLGSSLRASTGSGDIQASGFTGHVELRSGSGDIHADLQAANDVGAHSGSGRIAISGVNGGLFAETGSGNIEITGRPAAGWQLRSGSGDVTLNTGNAGFTLHASTGSGDIRSDPSISTHGSLGHHRISGDVNGGGPTVRVETGSGDIRIHS
jgi:hypothetical protein